jgi:DNA-directed RNA polymerase subunit RPC12/RpoP
MAQQPSPNSNLHDQSFPCIDCGKPFVFTAGEQQYFLDRELDLPKRCPRCRLARKLGIKPSREGE